MEVLHKEGNFMLLKTSQGVYYKVEQSTKTAEITAAEPQKPTNGLREVCSFNALPLFLTI